MRHHPSKTHGQVRGVICDVLSPSKVTEWQSLNVHSNWRAVYKRNQRRNLTLTANGHCARFSTKRLEIQLRFRKCNSEANGRQLFPYRIMEELPVDTVRIIETSRYVPSPMEWVMRRQEPSGVRSEIEQRCPIKFWPPLGNCSTLLGRR